MAHSVLRQTAQPVAHQYTDGWALDLAEALQQTIAGEVRFDTGSRALYATDLSIYRQVPVGVVIPRSLDDVVATVQALATSSRGNQLPMGRLYAGSCTASATMASGHQ